MLETILLVLILLVLAGGLYSLYTKLRQSTEKPADQSLLLLQQRLEEMNRTLDAKLGEANKSSTDSMRAQFAESQRLVNQFLGELGKMTEKVTRVEETGKQMVTFADQLQNLQDILKNPKQRGILGEYYLETVLKNVLPPGSYQMQYPFKDGTIVDAVVFVKDRIIPIDSKFSLENYNKLAEEKDPTERERLEKAFKQDLKNRIDETAKYVKPSEGTMEFAFMFIPHEAIYYDLLVAQVGAVKVNTRDLIEYAFKEKHVIIVSPTSFLAYLQTVLHGLNALKIEESAKEIRKNVEALGKHLMSYDEYMRKLGAHLGTTVNMYNAASKEFKKVDKDVVRITGGESTIETLSLEGPAQEE
ncbi:MAG TPA: DNA recombination protein RmuC [Candidatus Paceibacterota bacterium]|nr:DNA recombination protein RmuC [Candidatus Paceibacterota bacterium]